MKFGQTESALKLTISSLANGAGGQHLRDVGVAESVAVVQIDLVASISQDPLASGRRDRRR